MIKNKALMPSLREKKRYLAFEVLSKQPVTDFSDISFAIQKAVNSYLGLLHASKSGIICLKEKYNFNLQKGLIKVNHKEVDHVKAALCFIEKVGATDVIVKSLGVSGILKKAYNNYVIN